MVFNATFNNISVISWRSVLLVEATGIPGENYRSVAFVVALNTITQSIVQKRGVCVCGGVKHNNSVYRSETWCMGLW